MPKPITPTPSLLQVIDPLILEFLTSAIRDRGSESDLFLTILSIFPNHAYLSPAQTHLIMTCESIPPLWPCLPQHAGQCLISRTVFLRRSPSHLEKQSKCSAPYQFSLFIFKFLKPVVTYRPGKISQMRRENTLYSLNSDSISASEMSSLETGKWK